MVGVFQLIAAKAIGIEEGIANISSQEKR